MVDKTKLSEPVQELLCCPVCRSKLTMVDAQYKCTNDRCVTVFPIIKGVPVLINERSSVFPIDDFEDSRNTTFDLAVFENNGGKNVWQRLKEYTPSISENFRAEKNYAKFAKHLKQSSQTPRVLIVGGSIEGMGLKNILSDQTIEFVETDVSFGPRTMLICDAHDVPFDDESFDGLIVQAVLEHVADPYRCAEEIHRVLKNGGLVC